MPRLTLSDEDLVALRDAVNSACDGLAFDIISEDRCQDSGERTEMQLRLARWELLLKEMR